MKFGRRALLGSGAAALSGLAGPFAGLTRQVWAAGITPVKRLVVVTHGHGVGSIDTADFLTPCLPASPLGGRVGPNSPTADALTGLPKFMEPLAAFTDRTLIVDGLYNLSEDTLHGSRRGAYTCLTAVRASGDDAADGEGDFHGPSFEYAISRQLETPGLYLGGNTPFNASLFASATASGSPAEIPLALDPAAAFAATFGGAEAGLDAARLKARWAKKKSVLDFSLAHLSRTRAALPAAERPKLDQYEAAIRDLEKQLAAPPSTCTATADGVRNPSVPAPLRTMEALHPALAQQLRQQTEVLVNALACGKTRVGVLQISRQTDYSIYPGLADEAHTGQEMKHDLHTLYHAYPVDDWANSWKEFAAPQPSYDGMRLRHQQFLAQQVAYVVQRLSELPDAAAGGNAKLIDNTLVLWMSDSGGQHHGGAASARAVLIGGGLFAPKRILQFPRLYVGDHPKQVDGVTIYNGNRGNNFSECYATADLFVAIQRAFGVDTRSFGDAKYCRGPLPNLT